MNIIPPYISEECQSNAEKKVFRAFEKLKIPFKSFLFHSVNLPEHLYKQWGEIDFLLISQSGIMVFEVKGGRISRKDGIWTYTDRFGNNHYSREGPNEQAKSAKFSLQKKLRKQFPTINFKKITFGWAMIFPDIDYASKDLELPYEMVCDYDSMKRIKFEAFVNNLHKYFKKKLNHPKELLGEEIQDISNYIRPNIDLVPKLKTSIDETNLRLIKGTEEQYGVLNAALDNDRILCTGGAGTGKTLLAIEIAKRTPNKKILVICKSSILAKFIEGQISNEMVDVLCSQEILENKTFFTEEFEMMDSLQPVYDMFIVDEGQDLLSFWFISFLDRVLINNLENGCWRWFMDINNQAGVDSAFNTIEIHNTDPPFFSVDIESLRKLDDESELGYEMLMDSKPTKMKLTHNCRNTEEIIYDTQLNTGADIGIAKVKGRGTYPIYQKVSSSEETAMKLEEALDEWSDEIDYLNDIVILSTGPYDLSSAAHLSKKWQDKIQFLTEENVLNQDPRKILFSDVAQYKGLDKPIVVVIDIGKTMEAKNWEDGEEYKQQEDKDFINRNVESFIYVAMTRSNSILWIAVDDKLQKFLDENQPINYKKMTGV